MRYFQQWKVTIVMWFHNFGSRLTPFSAEINIIYQSPRVRYPSIKIDLFTSLLCQKLHCCYEGDNTNIYFSGISQTTETF